MTIQLLARALGLCGTSAIVICLSACPPSNVTPATPVNFVLEVPSDTLGHFTGFNESTPATATSPQGYNVLPLLTSTVIVRAYLTTPYPTGLAILATDNTGQSVTLPQVPANSPGPSTGYFQVISVGATNPTQWHIVIRYPDSYKSSRLITTAISDVAGQQASAPFAFALISTMTTVKVNIVTANNDGMVSSNPPGINCPGTCSFDFKGWSGVVLSQSVLHNQTEFTGWQGNCTGTGNTCSLPLNGTTVTATANFRVHQNTQPTTMMCPAAPVIAGWAYDELPDCGNAQGAILHCDAQGVFCCGAYQGGVLSQRCNGQNLTRATCGFTDVNGSTNPKEKLLPADQPLGCYVSDTFP